MSKLSIWLTPVWLLAVGVALGALVLLLLGIVCWLVNRRLGRAIFIAVKEGVLLPISYVVIAVTALAVVAIPSMPTDRLINSLKRLPYVGAVSFEETIPAHATDFEVQAPFHADELQSYSIQSDQDVAINVEQGQGVVQSTLEVEAGRLYHWSPGSNLPRIFDKDVQTLFVTNASDLPAVVKGTFQTDVEMPEVHDLPVTAGSVLALYLLYLLIRWLAPRVSIIATATAKEAAAQPIFSLLTIIGVVALVAYIYIPYNTFGEDVKMLKISGMTTIKVLAILVALWTASVSIA